MTTEQLQQLRNEFENDPDGIGYNVENQDKIIKCNAQYQKDINGRNVLDSKGDFICLGYDTRYYQGHWAEGNDQALLELINDKGINGVIDIPSISSSEIQNCVIAVEFSSLPETNRILWDMLTRGDSVAIGMPTVRDQITFIWAGTTTLTNIEALYTRDGSRAEELFGFGTQVTMQDIINSHFIQ